MGIQFSSVTQSCLTLCDPINCSMPGLPVHHQLLEFTQNNGNYVVSILERVHPSIKFKDTHCLKPLPFKTVLDSPNSHFSHWFCVLSLCFLNAPISYLPHSPPHSYLPQNVQTTTQLHSLHMLAK